MIKILHIVGARPQFIKLFPLHLEMKERGFNQKILHTGQHFDKNMSDVFFNEMGIPQPDFNLNIHSLPHGAMTGRMIEGIETILLSENFDYVVVYGDTNSTAAGAIAAKKLKIKVIHVEAGLRNFDNEMPEELNRLITDKISDLLFCPTEHCVSNLITENAINVRHTGDLMYDSIKIFKDKLKPSSKPYILFTCHRAENTTKKTLTEIIKTLNVISEDIDIIFPTHPRTKKILDTLDIKLNFKCIPPASYLEFLQLLNGSKYLITDSGGAVKEAYFLNKPSVLLLEKPVWPELVKEGVCYNCKSNEQDILDAFNKIKDKKINFNENIFGDGNSRKYMCDIIESYE